MWFTKWFDQEVFSYSDWVPWRKVRRALVFALALTAVLVPNAFRAAALAYVHHEQAVVTRLLMNMEHQMFCGPKQPESVRIAFCSRVEERDQHAAKSSTKGEATR